MSDNENFQLAYQLVGDVLTVVLDGKHYSVNRENEKASFRRVVEALNTNDKDEILAALDSAEPLKSFSEGDITVTNGEVRVNGELVHSTLAKRLVELVRLKLPVAPFKKFMANLSENPDENSREQLFDFLEAGSFPITEDGCFLGYKGVRFDFKDQHSGTFDNSPGEVIEMDRDEVENDPENACGPGLHVGTLDYAKNFAPRLVLVKVNPKDAVSVPRDHNCAKLRCCRYEVVATYEKDDKELARPVYTDDDVKSKTFDADEENAREGGGVPIPFEERLQELMDCNTRMELIYDALDAGLFRSVTEAREMGKEFVAKCLAAGEIPFSHVTRDELAKLAVRRKLFSSVSAAKKAGKTAMEKRLEADAAAS